MRLNFSASGEDRITEGIKRIGEVVAQQVELYEAITGEHSTLADPGSATTTNAPPGSVLPFRRRDRGS